MSSIDSLIVLCTVFHCLPTQPLVGNYNILDLQVSKCSEKHKHQLLLL